MAEFVMKHLAEQAGRADVFEIASAAVSSEETGNDIYPPAKRKLREKGIPFTSRVARQMTREDYRRYDCIVCMDRSNLRLLRCIIGEDTAGKVSLLMDWVGAGRDAAGPQTKGDMPRMDVADPWYTGDFEATFRDLMLGCTAMLEKL